MESPGSVELAKQVLSLVAIVLAVGTAFGIAAQKLRVPDVALFLLAGMLVGPGVAGLVDVRADSALNQLVLIFGACYILFDGGASLRLNVLKEVWITIVVLATLGVLITALITGVAAYYLLGIPFIVALLLAATIASTDPATLVPVFRQVKIKDRVAQTVMSESAFNDATGAIATFAVLGIALGKGEFSVPAARWRLISWKSTCAPSRMKMNMRMINAVVRTNSSSRCCSPGSILKPNRSLLPIAIPNTNTAMKPLACSPSAARYEPTTAMSDTSGAYSSRKPSFSCAMRSAAR